MDGFGLKAPAIGSFEASCGRAGVPARERAGALDELTDGDDGDDEGKVDVLVQHAPRTTEQRNPPPPTSWASFPTAPH